MSGQQTYDIAFRLGGQINPSLRTAMNTTVNNMNRLGGSIQSANSNSMNFSASLGRLASTAAKAYAAFKIADITKDIVQMGVAYDQSSEQAQVAWKTLLGSQAKAQQMWKDIANFAKATPFETADVDQMAKYMYNAGYAGKGLFNQLMKISDVASAFNIPIDSAKELTRQMAQVDQANVAYTEDLNIMQDRGVPIYKAIAKVMGTNIASVKKMASQGKITADVYNQAFASIAKGVKGASDAQSQTFTGLMSTVKDDMNMISGALAKPIFNGLKAGLDKVMPLLDGLNAWTSQGNLKGLSDGLNKTFGPQAGGMLAKFTQNVSGNMKQVGKWMGVGKQSIKVLFDYTKGDNIGAINLMTKMGLSTNSIVAIQKGVNGIKSAFGNLGNNLKPVLASTGGLIKSAFSGISDFWSKNGTTIISGAVKVFGVMGTVISGTIKVFGTVFNVIKPVLNDIGKFIMSTVQQIAVFWNQNGAQIMQAVRNVFNGISAIIKFLAPVILPILSSIWGNIKGVIQGALNIIMGVIKIFAGLFTGDFGKMWEGIKQVFSGAVQFLWNGINLLFVGKILGGIKSLGTGAINVVRGMWGKITGFFTGGAETTMGKINHMTGLVTGGFNFLKQKAISIVTYMWNKMSNIFGDIVGAARSLPGRMGNAIKSMAGKAWDGIKFLGNKILSGIGTVVNGVIGGLNWILPKLGIKLVIDQWKVPQYANGTNGHPGGLAVVGDGGGPELISSRNGLALSPGKSTLVNLPKGAQVLPYQQTKYLMNSGLIPAYAGGVGSWIKGTASNLWNGAKGIASAAWNGTKAAAGKVKDMALNVWSYIQDPSKLLSKVLEQLGIKVPDLAGVFKNIGSGAFSFIKDKAVGFLKGKIAGLGNFKGGAAAPAQVQSWIMAAMQATGTPSVWLNALTSLAMHESGGNPRAINLWDSNAKAGHPSKGLMQTIDSTFNAYKMNGLNDIWNPIHNAVAAIRYMIVRYKSIGNVPGIANMAQGKGYVGYAKGGKVPKSGWAMVGEQGPELMKLRGGSQIFSNKKSRSLLSNLLSFGTESTGTANENKVNNNSSQSVQIVFNPTYVIPNGSQESVKEAAKMSFEDFKKYMKQFEKEKKRLSFV